jgi:hypothetical protein
MSEKIGLIVDGEGECAAFKRRFSQNFKILKTDGPRGHTAAVPDVVSRAKKQVSILSAFKCRSVVVVIDFEARNVRYHDFVNALANGFATLQCGIPVSVAVPNRMIENWYLADIEFLSKKRSFLRYNVKQRNYEGTDGKKLLKTCFVRGITYCETRHGPQLFAILRFNVARRNSPSFDHFLGVCPSNS